MMEDSIAVSVKMFQRFRLFSSKGPLLGGITSFKKNSHVNFGLEGYLVRGSKGMILGIIGRNGSGSPLYSDYLLGLDRPPEELCTVKCLLCLELGAGFNPEFTGRDNVY
jgi:ABC-type polysaccharide/polyol phosphate transport system ATPase subunit